MWESLGILCSVLSILEGQRRSRLIKSQALAKVRSEAVGGCFQPLSCSCFSTYSPPYEFALSRHRGRCCDEGDILYLRCSRGHLSLSLAPEPWEGG